jgi:hypothetical protein
LSRSTGPLAILLVESFPLRYQGKTDRLPCDAILVGSFDSLFRHPDLVIGRLRNGQETPFHSRRSVFFRRPSSFLSSCHCLGLLIARLLSLIGRLLLDFFHGTSFQGGGFGPYLPCLFEEGVNLGIVSRRSKLTGFCATTRY